MEENVRIFPAEPALSWRACAGNAALREFPLGFNPRKFVERPPQCGRLVANGIAMER